MEPCKCRERNMTVDSPDDPEVRPDPEGVVTRGYVLLERAKTSGEIDNVRGMVDDLLVVDPGLVSALVLKGHIEWKRGRPERMMEFFFELIERLPQVLY